MSNKQDLQALWQNQITNFTVISPEEVVLLSNKFQKRIQRRNFAECAVCIAMLPILIYAIIHAKSTFNLMMSIEITLAIVYIPVHIYLWGRNIVTPDSASSTQTFLKYFKQQIERQIKLLSNVRYWYVFPFFIGIMGKTGEKIWLNWDLQNLPWGLILYFLFSPVVAGYVIWFNEIKAVRLLQEQLEKLNRI